MPGGLRMKTDIRGASLSEVIDELVDWAYHQMHVDRRSYFMVSQCLTDHWPDSKIRHVVIVHDIEMNDISARV